MVMDVCVCVCVCGAPPFCWWSRWNEEAVVLSPSPHLAPIRRFPPIVGPALSAGSLVPELERKTPPESSSSSSASQASASRSDDDDNEAGTVDAGEVGEDGTSKAESDGGEDGGEDTGPADQQELGGGTAESAPAGGGAALIDDPQLGSVLTRLTDIERERRDHRARADAEFEQVKRRLEGGNPFVPSSAAGLRSGKTASSSPCLFLSHTRWRG